MAIYTRHSKIGEDTVDDGEYIARIGIPYNVKNGDDRNKKKKLIAG